MPNFDLHKKIGYFVAIIFSSLFVYFVHGINMKMWQWVAVPIVIVFYSNIPDIDHHMSKLRRTIFLFIFFVLLVSIFIHAIIKDDLFLVVLPLVGALGIFILSIKHRGPTHTYLFAILASLPMLKFHWYLFTLAILSSFSHIFIDHLFSGLKRKIKKKLGFQKELHVHIGSNKIFKL